MAWKIEFSGSGLFAVSLTSYGPTSVLTATEARSLARALTTLADLSEADVLPAPLALAEAA